MAAIPSIADFTSASVTEGEFKTALADLHDYLTGLLGGAGTQAAALAALGVPASTVSTRSAAYTVTSADRGHVIGCAGTWTLTLSSAATLGAGFVVTAVNTGAGVITIDAAGSETISGGATWTMAAGDGVAMVSNGSGWLIFSSYKAQSVTPAGIQVFQTNGTFIVPAGVAQLRVTAFGGGGGGCGSGLSALPGNGGAGIAVLSVSAGSSIPVVIGAGGSGGTPGNYGGTGGNTTFGSLVTATGGSSAGVAGGFSTSGQIIAKARGNFNLQYIGGASDASDDGNTSYGRRGGAGMSGGGGSPAGSGAGGFACGPGSDGLNSIGGYPANGGGVLGGAAYVGLAGGSGGGAGGVIVEW